jgi:pilus assembly protein Flp/PilA
VRAARPPTILPFSGRENLTKEKDCRMRKLVQHLTDFIIKEDGPTAVEYAVMLALIVVVCIAAITTLGTNANASFTKTGTAINVAS